MLTRCGSVQKLVMVEQRLSVAGTAAAQLQSWQQAAPATLRWETHAPRAPLARFELLLPQINALLAQLPLGALDLPPPRQEMSSLRAWYDSLDAHGGQHHLAWLFAGDKLVAASHGSWDARTPDRAFQALTAVDAAWRGQGLSYAVKSRLLQALLRSCPAARCVVTHNAEGNAAILAANRRMGFSPYRVATSFQISVEALGSYLATRGA